MDINQFFVYVVTPYGKAAMIVGDKQWVKSNCRDESVVIPENLKTLKPLQMFQVRFDNQAVECSIWQPSIMPYSRRTLQRLYSAYRWT